jgi:hypothetical protein
MDARQSVPNSCQKGKRLLQVVSLPQRYLEFLGIPEIKK